MLDQEANLCGAYEMEAKATGMLSIYVSGETPKIIIAMWLQRVLNASVIFRHGFCSVLMTEKYGNVQGF